MVGYLSRLSYTPVSDDRLDGIGWNGWILGGDSQRVVS
jgi:hypothetical protein